MDRNQLLQGRTALITGSGQNIGRAIALLFAAAGANVVINGRRHQDKLDSVAQVVRSHGGQALTVLADVSVPEAVKAMVEQATETFGGVDIVVSNAAIRPRQALLDISIADWHQVLNTNLNAAFYLARIVLPGMQAKGWGRLIHIAGYDGFAGAPFRAHNVTCKGGIHAFSKAIAMEFGPDGITANTVSPGTIDTTRRAEDYPDLARKYERLKQIIPARRLGQPEDIAEACLFLASDLSSFINGQVIHVNGGAPVLSCHLPDAWL
jgi:NAD(P)-dependent dehydrogenase (short-subunit alcohol dehydrogenase family)